MSDEHDSWFKDAFGVDLGGAAKKIQDEVTSTATAVVTTVSAAVQSIPGTVEAGLGGIGGAISGAAKKVVAAAGGVPGSGSGGGAGGGGAADGGIGSFPLGSSVGRGGKNAANDVRAVQGALGISADGQCGGQTIAAIEAFQKKMGQAKPDGRVDAGGATERAMAGGGGAKSAPQSPPQADAGSPDDGASLFDKAMKGVGDLAGGLQDLGGKVIDGAGAVASDVNPAAELASAGADDGSAQSTADRIIATMKSGGDLRLFLGMLNNMEMRALLDVMDRLKRAGKLEDFADRTTTGNQRIGVAILTIRPEFDALWRKLVAGLNEADRKAVLERTPKSVQVSSGFAPKGGGGPEEDPGGTVEVDVAGVAVKAKIEFNSKAFGALGHGEVAIKLGADGKLHEVEVEVAKIKAKLEKLGKLDPILDLEASVSLKASAEISEHDKKTVVEGVKVGVATEIGVSFKKVPGLKKVTLKFTAGAGTGGFEFGGAIEIPIPGS